MKRFIVKVLSWFALLFIALVILDISLSRIIQVSYRREYASWNDILHGKASADVLVMGSSRAWRQYSPQVLDTVLNKETYNIGIDGSAIDRQINKYHIYRHYNRKPSVILQNVEYWTISITKGYERYQFFPYFWIPYFRKAVFPNESFSIGEKYLPFYRYAHFGVRNLFAFQNLFKDSNALTKGYLGADLRWDGSLLARIDSLKFEPDPLAIVMFEKYLQEAREEGIRVFLVFAPLYIDATLKIQNIDEMYAFYNSFADKYGAEIIDFTFNDISRDTSYFYNATHLNRIGAELFSIKLGHEVKTLLSGGAGR